MSVRFAAAKVDRVTALALHDYQVKQLNHDRTFHREIWVLGVTRGMNHVTLHLMKYLASLSALSTTTELNKRAFIDSFIMIVSGSNLLDISLEETVNQACVHKSAPKSTGFIAEYIFLLGEMAKACEATDHQEEYPIRTVWDKSLKRFLSLMIVEAEKRNMNILVEAEKRLKGVEENHSLRKIFREPA